MFNNIDLEISFLLIREIYIAFHILLLVYSVYEYSFIIKNSSESDKNAKL